MWRIAPLVIALIDPRPGRAAGRNNRPLRQQIAVYPSLIRPHQRDARTWVAAT